MLIAQEEAVPADKRELVIHTGKLRKKSLLSGAMQKSRFETELKPKLVSVLYSEKTK